MDDYFFFNVLAEKFLDSADNTPNFGLSLLQLLTEESADDVVRIASAVTFKNFIKKNWRMVRSSSFVNLFLI